MSRPAAKWSTAFNRFGLGAHGAGAPSSGDPLAAIEAELHAPGAGLIRNLDLPSCAQALRIFFDFAAAQEKTRVAAAAMRAADGSMPAPAMAVLATATQMDPMTVVPKEPPRTPVAEAFLAEASARIAAACDAPVGFVERLVAFWSNHFCVSTAKGLTVRVSAGAFEREAIRPFVLGKFADMLKAVEQHPTMLYYLDNSQSVGPSSQAGRRTHRGLNENLAREILELHTLGVDGGYSQADVMELAAALTGWTVVGREGKLGPPGSFVFNAYAHEGGARNLRGLSYSQAGIAQGEAALADLARAPPTARHIATKLARAFVADAPPPPLVGRLTQVFEETDGDLGALARALVADEDAWSAPPTKLRDPWQMMIAAYRALELDSAKPNRILSSLSLLGMPLWTPGGPNGFPDSAAAWASPEGIKTRVEIAAGLGRMAKDAPPPRELIERVLPDVSDMTRDALLRAESRPQAYALLILAPEFQRR